VNYPCNILYDAEIIVDLAALFGPEAFSVLISALKAQMIAV